MDYFMSMPEGCISEIFSLTSPKDAVRSSVVSRGFKSITESDAVWEKYLPSDYQDIIKKSKSFPVYSSKKELYFRLCNSPIIFDRRKLSISLDKKTGKKCLMVAAKALVYTWDDLRYWGISSHQESRFKEVACVTDFRLLYISGKIGSQLLSKRTTYAAYLVFKQTVPVGLEISNSVVRFVNCEKATEQQNVMRISNQKRLDDWMEIEVGNFFNDTGEDGDVEVKITGIRRCAEIGSLLVQGIEFRPK